MSVKTPNYHPNKNLKKRLFRNIVISFLLMLFSLSIGMVGYHYYASYNWVDSYLNASMILSGMGQVSELETVEGKIFAGTYALFSGVVFLILMAVLMAPLVHHYFRNFIAEEKNS